MKTKKCCPTIPTVIPNERVSATRDLRKLALGKIPQGFVSDVDAAMISSHFHVSKQVIKRTIEIPYFYWRIIGFQNFTQNELKKPTPPP